MIVPSDAEIELGGLYGLLDTLRHGMLEKAGVEMDSRQGELV
ncbi:MAG: hypothetical protein ACRELF_14295 [Gemmataceae bacterium]